MRKVWVYSDEQKLINICFELVLVATADKVFCKKTNEEKAKWVADQLRGCGFDTHPCGSSWGVIQNDGHWEWRD